MATARIGESLKTARARLGWTREALAYHSGVSWSAIAQIESGRRQDVRLSSLVALASALGVSVDFLIGTAGRAPQLFEHRVLTYGSDEAFGAGTVPFIAEGVQQEHCILAVTSPAKISLLRDQLGDGAGSVEFADWTDWYSSPSAALNRYRAYVTKQCDRGGEWVRIVAEAGWADGTDEEIAGWTRYESVVNLAFAPWPATIMCTYDENAFSPETLAEAHTTHPAIVRGSETTSSAAYREPGDVLLD